MILCLCQRGNVRSATCATVLRDCFGVADVIATGVQTTTPEIMNKLALLADTILIVADDAIYQEYVLNYGVSKVTHLNVGVDQWMTPMHPNLVARIVEALGKVGFSTVPLYGTVESYLNANEGAWARYHAVPH